MKWKDIKKERALARKASIDLDEQGDGIIVSEREANEICASLRSRSSSETSSYSEHSESSSDTSLCDNHDSDSETDLPEDDKKKSIPKVEKKLSPMPVLKESKISPSPEKKNNLITFESVPKDISDYIETDAGKQLRTYIDGFETMLKESDTEYPQENNKPTTPSPLKTLDAVRSSSPYSKLGDSKSDVIERLNKSPYRDSIENAEYVRPTRLPKSPKNFMDLSPIEISPCNFGINRKSPCNFDFKSSIKYPTSSTKPDPVLRHPDIIESLTKHPNFVPDIDLSDKNISDLESPPRSPGAESIVVSEDEPPIPLKIDKYFEHSPEFFGARITVTDPMNSDIHSRRPFKRHIRVPKKPDSLTLQSSFNEKLIVHDKEEARASSLPQSHSFTTKTDETISNINAKEDETENIDDMYTSEEKSKVDEPLETKEAYSPKDYFLRSGRKNSERALQIIQENSKILSRILTKQSLDAEANKKPEITKMCDVSERDNEEFIESPILKESTSDSLIGCRRTNLEDAKSEKNEFVRIRPISIDDPFSLDSRNSFPKPDNMLGKHTKSPSTESLMNKTDLYGWENKGFLAKCDYKSLLSRPEDNIDYHYTNKKTDQIIKEEFTDSLLRSSIERTKHSISEDSKPSVTLPSSELKETSPFELRTTSDDYNNYTLSTKYNDFVLSKASDICSQTADQGPKVCESISKTNNGQHSDFSQVVTSSISFTYEPTAEDDFTGAKSNSSDTLCQITSLDQVSTPISPKIFPRDTPTLPKDFSEKNDPVKIDSDDTCSAITSLIETDNTLSSLSYPRSPSTGSYHPFPTRPAIRLPKELGVRLGMYPKETVSSPPK